MLVSSQSHIVVHGIHDTYNFGGCFTIFNTNIIFFTIIIIFSVSKLLLNSSSPECAPWGKAVQHFSVQTSRSNQLIIGKLWSFLHFLMSQVTIWKTSNSQLGSSHAGAKPLNRSTCKSENYIMTLTHWVYCFIPVYFNTLASYQVKGQQEITMALKWLFVLIWGKDCVVAGV